MKTVHNDLPDKLKKKPMDIVKNFDPRSYDEMEELKKIFYSFFVQGEKIVLN